MLKIYEFICNDCGVTEWYYRNQKRCRKCSGTLSRTDPVSLTVENTEEKEICEIALFLAGKRSEGQLARALGVDRLEARTRVQARVQSFLNDAQVPIETE